MSSHPVRRLVAAIGSMSMLVALAACGESESQAPASGDTSKIDVVGAKAHIAGVVDGPSRFPVDEPLLKKLPAGSEIVFLDPGTSFTEIQWKAFEAAADQMGVDAVRIKAGLDANSVNAAADAAVARKPAAVAVVAVDPVLLARQIEELRANGATVVASAIQNGEEYGFGKAVPFGKDDSEYAGTLLGAWTIARNEGKVTDIVLYNVPELSFSKPSLEAAAAKIKELCSVCKTRFVDIPITQLGTGAPQRIVSDLQSHPSTQGAIMSTAELAVGLPAALTTAGLKLVTVGNGAGPANLQQIKEGQEDAGLATDLLVQMWGLLDQIVRQATGQELTSGQAVGEVVKQFITADNVPEDPSRGWVGYPDVAERFAALWADAS